MSDLPCPVGSDTKTAFSFKEASMTSSCLGFRLEWPMEATRPIIRVAHAHLGIPNHEDM